MANCDGLQTGRVCHDPADEMLPVVVGSVWRLQTRGGRIGRHKG